MKSVHNGTSEDWYHWQKFEFAWGLSESVFLGGKFENNLSWTNEFSFGLQTGITVAGFLKYTGGFGIDHTTTKLDDTPVKLKNANAEIAASTARIDNIVTGLNNSRVCDIRSGMLTVFT